MKDCGAGSIDCKQFNLDCEQDKEEEKEMANG
jgi:hypothetical protein